MDKAIQDELDLLRDIIVNTLPVEQIFLFGSYAYGTPHKDSDLDLYVVLKDSVEMRDIDASIKIRIAVRDYANMPLDILVAKQSAFARRKVGPTMERHIVREGRVIYG
ncbi:MAG: nucleotidyltransferase domain-containing protein [Treponema sp.]|jgi:predicted nucleotidyltransferase|nr:nucleotidyltransferase domain-containing protein [Treponema sp.]